MSDRATFRLQHSYEFWAERLYLDGGASPNVLETQRRAAAALLNKINIEPHILRDIPTRSDWRVFECIVAEVFLQFGYYVQLTAKTRDGGRDIIALSKPGESHERLLIECKHWKNKVDVKAVRGLVGVAIAEDKNNPNLPTSACRRFAFRESRSLGKKRES